MVIEDKYYYFVNVGSYYYLNCYYKLTNTSTHSAISGASIDYRILNEDKKILKTGTFDLPSIASNDTVYYTQTLILSSSDVPAIVSSFVNYDDYDNLIDAEFAEIARSNELVVLNPYRVPYYGYSTHFTGEVLNTSSYDLYNVWVSVLYKKDGELYGGESYRVGTIQAGEKRVFDMTTFYEPGDFDSYTIVAVQK